MQNLCFNLIGAGRLGKNIAISLMNAGQASLTAVVSKQFSNAKQACFIINNGQPIACLADLPQAQLVFITTPDDVIESITLELAEKKVISPGTVVIHCSGALSSEILKPLQAQGCFIANFHPLKAFRTNRLDHLSFMNCDCAMEGDEQALTILSSLFKPLGANLISIKTNKKVIYHAAAVMAANHLVTLAAQAIQLFTNAGIEEHDAKNMTTRLMQTSLTNIQHAPDLSSALTGPLVRGDLNTVAMHLKAQEQLATLPLYKLLSLQSLPLTSLSSTKKDLLIKLLSS